MADVDSSSSEADFLLPSCLPPEAFDHFRIREQQLLQLNNELESQKKHKLAVAEERTRNLARAAETVVKFPVHYSGGSNRSKSAAADSHREISGEEAVDNNYQSSIATSSLHTSGSTNGRAYSEAECCKLSSSRRARTARSKLSPAASAKNQVEGAAFAPLSKQNSILGNLDVTSCENQKHSEKQDFSSAHPAKEAAAKRHGLVMREAVLKDPYVACSVGSKVRDEYMRTFHRRTHSASSKTGLLVGETVESLTSAMRIQRSRMLSLQEELDARLKEMRRLEEELHQSKSENRCLIEENEEQKKHINNLQSQVDRLKKLHAECTADTETLKNSLSTLQAENDRLAIAAKNTAAEFSSKDVRLNRLTEEAQSLKDKLQNHTSRNKDESSTLQKEIDKLIVENKRLQSQRNDLIIGFKKQMKLIDILKKQKAHMEAARLLSFSEEEFLSILRIEDKPQLV